MDVELLVYHQRIKSPNERTEGVQYPQIITPSPTPWNLLLKPGLPGFDPNHLAQLAIYHCTSQPHRVLVQEAIAFSLYSPSMSFFRQDSSNDSSRRRSSSRGTIFLNHVRR
eukprot:5905729-Pleurochrysis_carterae.AAC.1